MIVRNGVFERLDHEDRDWAIEAVRDVQGVRSVLHVVDREAGRWLSLGVFDSEAAIDAATAAIGARRVELSRSPAGPDREERYEVVRGFSRKV